MLEQVWYFFESFWSSMDIVGYTDGISFDVGTTDIMTLPFSEYLTMLSTICVGILIIVALIGFVIWSFKFFSGLIKR